MDFPLTSIIFIIASIAVFVIAGKMYYKHIHSRTYKKEVEKDFVKIKTQITNLKQDPSSRIDHTIKGRKESDHIIKIGILLGFVASPRIWLIMIYGTLILPSIIKTNEKKNKSEKSQKQSSKKPNPHDKDWDDDYPPLFS